MTRPSHDWLADAEGNLRPEVARALVETLPAVATSTGRAAAPARTRSNASPRRTPPRNTAQVWLGTSVLWLGAVLVAVGVMAAWHHVHPATPSPSVQQIVPLPAGGTVEDDSVQPTARPSIIGTNVVLRAAPSIEAEDLGRLSQGDAVAVAQCQDTWCAVRTAAGQSGWVFAAYVHGVRGPWVGPGIVTLLCRLDLAPEFPLLRPGDKVLVTAIADEHALLALPDGRHVAVPRDAVVVLE